MLGGDSAQLTGQDGAADGLDLVGVDLGPQAVLQAGLQHLAGLLHREGVGLAEHVAELGDALFLHLGHHLLAHRRMYSARLLLYSAGTRWAPIKVATTSMGWWSFRSLMTCRAFSSWSVARP